MLRLIEKVLGWFIEKVLDRFLVTSDRILSKIFHRKPEDWGK
ncbi:hypothetical protein ES703_58098 [subsurface metagenome]